MKTSIATDYAIEPADLDNASDEEVRPFVELVWVLDEEAIPEDPRKPFEAIAARMRVPSRLYERWRWGVWTPDRQLVAQLFLGRSTQDNLHIRDTWIGVHPEHRHRGIGRSLFATAVEAIVHHERTWNVNVRERPSILLQAWTQSRVPSSAAFAERVGAKPGLRARASQLELGSIDRGLMREWASIDPAGYRLEWIDGDTPDRLMDNVVTAIRTMNTMPREDLQWEDWKITPDSLREWDRLRRERGTERWMVLAIAERTGATAGFTEIFFDPRIPSVLHQGGTAVVPEHRGRGIGKWVKARMAERVLREMPEARYIRTENAGSNAAMLAINVGMGFEPAWEEVIWQLPLADAQRYVAGRAR